MTRAVRWRRRAALAALAIAAAAPVLAIVLLGWWNRFVADDFSMGARLRTMGVFGAWRDQLTVLNGRFAGYLISDVLASPKVPRSRKRDVILGVAARYRDSTSYVMSRREWLEMSGMMGGLKIPGMF